jgi:glycosyltransferase involved in cell wall biosynthesis
MKCLKETAAAGFSIDWICPSVPGIPATTVEGKVRIIRRGGALNIYLLACLYYLSHREAYSLVIDSITGVPWFTPLYCRTKRLSVIYHLGRKETFFTELPSERGALGVVLAGYGYLLERSIGVLYKRERLITFSNSTKADLVELGLNRDNITVIQEGIEIGVHVRADKFSQPTLVYVGRLVRNKGVQYLIAAIAILRNQIPNLRLLIIGRGYYETSLKGQVETLHLGSVVEFLGHVDEEKKYDILARANCVVIPSLREGWATPVIEAASVGTPAVGTDAIGIRETIVEGRTGFLVAFGSPRALAEAVRKILTDKKLLENLGDNAYANAQSYNISATTRGFVELVQKMTVDS